MTQKTKTGGAIVSKKFKGGMCSKRRSGDQRIPSKNWKGDQ